MTHKVSANELQRAKQMKRYSYKHYLKRLETVLNPTMPTPPTTLPARRRR